MSIRYVLQVPNQVVLLFLLPVFGSVRGISTNYICIVSGLIWMAGCETWRLEDKNGCFFFLPSSLLFSARAWRLQTQLVVLMKLFIGSLLLLIHQVITLPLHLYTYYVGIYIWSFLFIPKVQINLFEIVDGISWLKKIVSGHVKYI